MAQTDQSSNPITSCHNVEAKVYSADEGTSHYYCPVCNSPVEPNGKNNSSQSSRELREILKEFSDATDYALEAPIEQMDDSGWFDRPYDEAIKAIEAYTAQKVADVLKYIEQNLPGETDCAEFYIDDWGGCEPKEHERRSARFYYKMEVEELLESLKQESTSSKGKS